MIEFIVGCVSGSIIVYFIMKSRHDKRIDEILINVRSNSPEELL